MERIENLVMLPPLFSSILCAAFFQIRFYDNIDTFFLQFLSAHGFIFQLRSHHYRVFTPTIRVDWSKEHVNESSAMLEGFPKHDFRVTRAWGSYGFNGSRKRVT